MTKTPPTARLQITTLVILLLTNHPLFANSDSTEPTSQIAEQYRCDLNTQIDTDECEVLRQIYRHSNGDNWHYAQHATAESMWFSNATPCEWQGVTCHNGQITELTLSANNMQGQLPNLSSLTHLEQLTINQNPLLSGNLPHLSELENLTHLTINHTGLYGFLPELKNLPMLDTVDVSHNQFIGPVPELFATVQFQGVGNRLCLSPRLHYDSLSNSWPDNIAGDETAQAEYANMNGFCQPMLRSLLHGRIDVTHFGAIANDNLTDNQAINHAITMLTLTLPNDLPLTNLTLHFPPGVYDMEKSIVISDFNAVRVTGERDENQNNLSVLRKTEQFGNNHNQLIQKSKHGALIELSYGYDVTIKHIQLEGQHSDSSNTYLWWDHGIYFGSVDHSVVTENSFYDFGDSALTIVTDTEDNRGAINSANHLVFANYFYNIMQTSTTSSYGGSMEYNFIGNTAEHVKGAIKFSTRKEGAGFLNIIDNTIISSGIEEGMSTNNGIEIEGYRNVNIIGNTLSDGNGVGIVIRSVQNGTSQSAFKWGNVFITSNRINNYRQGIYISNLPHSSDGSLAPAENINISGNLIKNMWNGDNQAAIQFVGQEYVHCKVTNNKIIGGRYDLWSEQDQSHNQPQWLLVEGNVID